MQYHIKDGKSECYEMLSKNKAPIANVKWKTIRKIVKQDDKNCLL